MWYQENKANMERKMDLAHFILTIFFVKNKEEIDIIFLLNHNFTKTLCTEITKIIFIPTFKKVGQTQLLPS